MARSKKLHRFYTSKEWLSFRAILITDNIRKNRKLICEHCGKEILKSIEAIGHHKIELTDDNVDNVSISLNPDEVEIICFDCHNKEHKRFGYKPEKKVYLIYGPPCSGKKTYVRQHMMRGDIIIDMDQLYQAMTMLPIYDKPNNLIANVRTIYNKLLDNVLTRFGKWDNAWIIGGYADKYKRDDIVNNIGAELIFLDVQKEECYARLEQDIDRQSMVTEWKGYIDKWFNNYRE